MPKKKAGPGRPARISRERIAKAALAIGLDRVTLVLVARRLKVDHSSLYRHVASRDELLLIAADLAIAELKWETETKDWRKYLTIIGEAVWGLYEQHLGLAEAIRSLETTPAAGVQAFSRSCARLHELGFTTEQAVLLMDSIMDMTLDAAIYAHKLRRQKKKRASAQKKMAQSWRKIGPAAETPPAAQVMSEVITGNSKEWWRKKLKLLLAGAEVMIAKKIRSVHPISARN